MKNSIKNDCKYRAKMVKGKKGWIVKGLWMSVLPIAFVVSANNLVEADSWHANSVESISNRIHSNDKSLEMIKGDTVYNIGLALNIKDPMQLLYQNGYKNGDQYDLPVGTKISWDGNWVTFSDKKGNVVAEVKVEDSQKHHPEKTIANQTSDQPQYSHSDSKEKQSVNVRTESKEKSTVTSTNVGQDTSIVSELTEAVNQNNQKVVELQSKKEEILKDLNEKLDVSISLMNEIEKVRNSLESNHEEFKNVYEQLIQKNNQLQNDILNSQNQVNDIESQQENLKNENQNKENEINNLVNKPGNQENVHSQEKTVVAEEEASEEPKEQPKETPVVADEAEEEASEEPKEQPQGTPVVADEAEEEASEEPKEQPQGTPVVADEAEEEASEEPKEQPKETPVVADKTENAEESKHVDSTTSEIQVKQDIYTSQQYADFIREFTRLLNQHRVNHQLKAVRSTVLLNRAAEIRAYDEKIVLENPNNPDSSWNHLRPDGSSPEGAIQDARNEKVPETTNSSMSSEEIQYLRNENLLVNSFFNFRQNRILTPEELASQCFEQWKHSKLHNANMLDQKMEFFGVGFYAEKDRENKAISAVMMGGSTFRTDSEKLLSQLAYFE